MYFDGSVVGGLKKKVKTTTRGRKDHSSSDSLRRLLADQFKMVPLVWMVPLFVLVAAPLCGGKKNKDGLTDSMKTQAPPDGSSSTPAGAAAAGAPAAEGAGAPANA
ncbi:unnamed protein product [Caenorhabditis auriculariae]|uniref:Uncharacterized protein n=1 Tax=Caenorhabditis auriculariae TaxID=2777116 RepID=A0A8S1HFI0_9PELO|nr:unnamed protein product [Caenorhabditis auriculariae]